MESNEIITALNGIRDEARQTNARLDEYNQSLNENTERLDRVERRVDSLEHRVDEGFAESKARLDVHAERWDILTRQVAASEMRLATQMASVNLMMTDVRDLLVRRLDDHAMVIDHEHRIKALEARDTARNPE